MSQIQEKFKKVIQTMLIIQSSPGINSTEIAAKLNTSTRSVQRYIKTLRDTGLEIESSSGHMGGFLCRKGYQFNPIYLTPEERTMLTLAVNTLNNEGFPLFKELSSAVEKIAGYRDQTTNSFFSIMLPPRGNYDIYNQFIVELKDLIANKTRIEIKYASFSSGEVKRRKVDPYHVALNDGFLYLIGYCHLRNEIRTFRIDRIDEFSALNEKFNIDSEFVIDKYIKNSWSIAKGEQTKVVIKFTSPISKLIKEAIWHESQQIEDLENESILFTVVVEGTWEIKKWIYGFGKYAEVIEPDSLRKEIIEELGEMVRNYSL